MQPSLLATLALSIFLVCFDPFEPTVVKFFLHLFLLELEAVKKERGV